MLVECLQKRSEILLLMKIFTSSCLCFLEKKRKVTRLTSGATEERCRIRPGTERMLSINKLLRLSEKLLRIRGLKEI